MTPARPRAAARRAHARTHARAHARTRACAHAGTLFCTGLRNERRNIQYAACAQPRWVTTCAQRKSTACSMVQPCILERDSKT
eukprot:7109334-Alexandrium_andersonii.AAC.1